jgi:hypothetical protein
VVKHEEGAHLQGLRAAASACCVGEVTATLRRHGGRPTRGCPCSRPGQPVWGTLPLCQLCWAVLVGLNVGLCVDEACPEDLGAVNVAG